MVLYRTRGAGAFGGKLEWNRLDHDIVSRRALLGGLSLLTLAACTGGGFDFGGFGGPTIRPDNGRSAARRGPDLRHRPGARGAAAAAHRRCRHRSAPRWRTAPSSRWSSSPAMPTSTTTSRSSSRTPARRCRRAAAAAQQAVQRGRGADPRAAQAPTRCRRRAACALGRHPADRLFQQFGRRAAGRLSAQRAARERGQAFARLRQIDRQARLRRHLPQFRLWPHPAERLHQAASELGLRVVGVYSFGSEAEARDASSRSRRCCRPARSTRCSCPTAPPRRASACCSRRPRSPAAPSRSSAPPTGTATRTSSTRPGSPGALYPAVDDAGYQALLPLYQQQVRRHAPPLRHPRLYRRRPRQRLVAVAGHAALRPRPAHHPRRLQRPRRRVPVPVGRAQRIRAGDQEGRRGGAQLVDGPRSRAALAAAAPNSFAANAAIASATSCGDLDIGVVALARRDRRSSL